MKRRLTVLITAAVLATAAILSGCSSRQPSAEPSPEVVRDVAVLDARLASVPDVMECVGTVRALQSASLSAQVMGTVMAVNAHEGDRVKRGQILAVIDDTELRAATERAQAAVGAADHEAVAAEAERTLASATMKRYQDLYDKRAVSPQEFDEVKARMQGATARQDMARSGQAQARAALAQAKTMLDFTRIRAPFDGVVTERRVDPGALATPGMPLMTVEAGGNFRLEATVDESSLHDIKLGEPVNVTVEALGNQALRGKVSQIVPAADSSSRSFIVKVALPANPQLRSGVFGRAQFVHGERQSLVVPRSAVVQRGQLQGLYVVGADQIANLRYVTLGKSDGDNVEVLSGVQPGDRLVAAPGPRDLSGKKVQ